MTGSSVYARSLGGKAVVMIGGINESEGHGVVMKSSEKWSRIHDIRFGFSTLPLMLQSNFVTQVTQLLFINVLFKVQHCVCDLI